MSVLTRIKNNQILDSTIYANAKIVPGSIVGSLFNTNLTMTSDVTITGNLTVQGASTYLTVASTNTYVNDPLVVLNNGFAGTNTYDEGIVFNRGSLLNQAFIWNEFNKEFRLIGTTETGTTYGSITAETNYEKLRLGNLVAQYDVSTITLTATGFINTTGNISGAVINGGAINSTGLINTTGNVLASSAVLTTATINGNLVTGGAKAEQGLQVYKPTANVAITANVNVSRVLIAPIATISFGTIVTLPNTTVNGTTVDISSNVATTLQPVAPWLTSIDPAGNVQLTAGSSARYFYYSTDNTWFKV